MAHVRNGGKSVSHLFQLNGSPGYCETSTRGLRDRVSIWLGPAWLSNPTRLEYRGLEVAADVMGSVGTERSSEMVQSAAGASRRYRMMSVPIQDEASMDAIRVVGVHLAHRSGSDNASALLEFDPSGWRGCRRANVNPWPDGPVTVEAMVDVLDAQARANAVAAVCLDGPQGWREPGVGANDRPGCGRMAEYEVRAPGKVGEYGRTYPRNQAQWMTFCIDVFNGLLARPGVRLANDPVVTRLPPPVGGYYLLEVYPTAIWRASELAPLPGRHRTTLGRRMDGQRWLVTRYRMPDWFVLNGVHDDLQAVVAALPGVGLFGGPAVPKPHGIPARWLAAAGTVPAHRVEGLIWDASPAIPGELPPTDRSPPAAPTPPPDGENPLLPDDRDEDGEMVFDRGVNLFRHLVRLAQGGESVGIEDADFVIAMYGAQDYTEVMGRGYANRDREWIIQLADQVTALARGCDEVTRGGTTIRVGMDSFIWPTQKPHTISGQGLAEHRMKYGSTMEDWAEAFPEESRRLLSRHEARRAASGQ